VRSGFGWWDGAEPVEGAFVHAGIVRGEPTARWPSAPSVRDAFPESNASSNGPPHQQQQGPLVRLPVLCGRDPPRPAPVAIRERGR
jgi:hypothetical protein